MASGQQHLHQVTVLIERQIDAMRALHECLQTERQALDARSADGLSRAADGKAEQLTEIGKLEQERLRLVPDAQAMSLACAHEPALAERWQTLLELTAHCRDLNESNGTMIRWQRRRVEGTLGLLRGVSGPAVYGPDGGNLPAARYRAPLASA